MKNVLNIITTICYCRRLSRQTTTTMQTKNEERVFFFLQTALEAGNVVGRNAGTSFALALL